MWNIMYTFMTVKKEQQTACQESKPSKHKRQVKVMDAKRYPNM